MLFYTLFATNKAKPILIKHKWATAWDFQQCGMCDQQSLRSACAYAQSDQSLCSSLEYSMSVKLLTEHNLEFLGLKWGYTGLSESTLVTIPHCWKSCVVAHISWCCSDTIGSKSIKKNHKKSHSWKFTISLLCNIFWMKRRKSYKQWSHNIFE